MDEDFASKALNPWQVESVDAFFYLCCPECVYRSKEVSTFEAHALQNHPMSAALFSNVPVEVVVKEETEPVDFNSDVKFDQSAFMDLPLDDDDQDDNDPEDTKDFMKDIDLDFDPNDPKFDEDEDEDDMSGMSGGDNDDKESQGIKLIICHGFELFDVTM